jgi:hypothetical protein
LKSVLLLARVELDSAVLGLALEDITAGAEDHVCRLAVFGQNFEFNRNCVVAALSLG